MLNARVGAVLIICREARNVAPRSPDVSDLNDLMSPKAYERRAEIYALQTAKLHDPYGPTVQIGQ